MTPRPGPPGAKQEKCTVTVASQAPTAPRPCRTQLPLELSLKQRQRPREATWTLAPLAEPRALLSCQRERFHRHLCPWHPSWTRVPFP